MVLAAALCGCGAGYTFSPYAGVQQNWATGAGGYVKQIDHAMLFPPGQLPARHYVIIGSISTDSEDNMAKAVREQHADAALISTDTTYRSGSVGIAMPGLYVAEPLRHRVITANLIRFAD